MKLTTASHTLRQRVRRAFTLLEMVIVMGIIGLIVGGAVGLMGGFSGAAEIQRVEGDFKKIEAALLSYKTIGGDYPTTGQGIQALVDEPTSGPKPRRWSQGFTSVPKDPWNEEYIYKAAGKKDPSKFEIISKGKDKTEGTDDDISSQEG